MIFRLCHCPKGVGQCQCRSALAFFSSLLKAIHNGSDPCRLLPPWRASDGGMFCCLIASGALHGSNHKWQVNRGCPVELWSYLIPPASGSEHARPRENVDRALA